MMHWLAATPEQLSPALRYTDYIAHAAYRIGLNNQIIAAPLPDTLHGGLLMITDFEAPPVTQPEFLASQLLQECIRRNYRGIVLDFELPVTSDRSALAAVLDRQCANMQRILFVPEGYGSHTQQAAVLVNTAITTGSLHQKLTTLPYPPQRIAMDCQRMASELPLPFSRGTGTPLPPDALHRHIEKQDIRFSRDLCAKYFTIRQGNSQRLILFDDAQTFLRKMELGEELGIQAAFFVFPEIADLPADFFPEKRKNQT